MTTKSKDFNIDIWITDQNISFSAKELDTFTEELQDFLGGWGIDATVQVAFATTLRAIAEGEDEEDDDDA